MSLLMTKYRPQNQWISWWFEFFKNSWTSNDWKLRRWAHNDVEVTSTKESVSKSESGVVGVWDMCSRGLMMNRGK